MEARNEQPICKHLKSLNKSASWPKLMMKGVLEFTKKYLTQFFPSVFTPKSDFNRDIRKTFKLRTQHSQFSVSPKDTSEILSSLDVVKSRGMDGITAFLLLTSRHISSAWNTMFKYVKRLRTICKSWKIAAVTSIHKKGDRKFKITDPFYIWT